MAERGGSRGRPRGVGDKVGELVLEMLKEVGAFEDPGTSKSLDLANTPRRVSRMYREELLHGYAAGALKQLDKSMTVFSAQGSTRELLTQGPIPFSSLCAHHLMPFFGGVWVGYIPDGRIIGLSKFARVVRHFSAKLQVQERLTTEVADYLVSVLEPSALIVLMEARHLCMELRGIRTPGVVTKTSALRGSAMVDPSVKSEFLSLIKG